MKYLKNIFSQGLWKEEEGIKRGWGEEKTLHFRISNPRNIPTGVGRSLFPYLFALIFAEHPHGGGEKELVEENPNQLHGTSPRGWGEGRG